MIKLGKISVETKAVIPDPGGVVVDPVFGGPEKIPLARGWEL